MNLIERLTEMRMRLFDKESQLLGNVIPTSEYYGSRSREKIQIRADIETLDLTLIELHRLNNPVMFGD